jgi:ABC-2 type transport system permease protein
MNNTFIVCRKEVKSYLGSPMAYVVTAVFLALSGTFFGTYLASTSYSDTSIRGFLSVSQYLILLFSAVLSMRLIAEEKKLGTWELLMTVPLRDSEIILGKYLSSLVLLTAMLALTIYYPVLLAVFGDPDVGPIVTSYIGLFLLGAVSLAAGIYASSLTSNQIVAAVVAGGLLFALWFLGVAATLIEGPVGELIAYLSLSTYFPDFVRGVIDTQALVYYVSLTAVFLFLSVHSTTAGRWK